MATYTDANGIHYALADTSLQSNSQAWLAEVARTVVRASDLDDVANYYRQWFGVNWAPRPAGKVITAADHNELRQAIVDGMDGAWVATLPPVKNYGDLIVGLSWFKPTATFTSATYIFNSPGTYQVWVPAGGSLLSIEQMVGAGGGGGYASETENGWSGGSGGSGGYRASENYTITPRQTITVVIGAGGGALGAGGNTTVYTANATITCTGGGPGGGNIGWYNGTPGYGGAPNGNPGTHGSSGGNDRASGDGPAGADSPIGQGGHGGNPWAGDGQGYGSGGGGPGFRDRTSPWQWFGGSGACGYCRITLSNPEA